MPVWITSSARSRIYEAGISEWKDKNFCDVLVPLAHMGKWDTVNILCVSDMFHKVPEALAHS